MRFFTVTGVGLLALIGSLCVSVALASNADSLVVGDFIYKIETDTTHYLEGGIVPITFTVTYIGAEPATIRFGCASKHALLFVYDSADSLVWMSGCLWMGHSHFMQPGESLVDVDSWDAWNYMLDEPAAPGVYRVLAEPVVIGEPYSTVYVIIELLEPPTGIDEGLFDAETAWYRIKAIFRRPD